MASFRRLYPYRELDAKKAFFEIWINRQLFTFARNLDPQTYIRLRNLLIKTADEGKLSNEEMYKHIGEGIYEFKYRVTRIYCFDDGRRVVLTHGGKHVKRSADERQKARNIRLEYLRQQGRKE